MGKAIDLYLPDKAENIQIDFHSKKSMFIPNTFNKQTEETLHYTQRSGEPQNKVSYTPSIQLAKNIPCADCWSDLDANREFW